MKLAQQGQHTKRKGQSEITVHDVRVTIAVHAGCIHLHERTAQKFSGIETQHSRLTFACQQENFDTVTMPNEEETITQAEDLLFCLRPSSLQQMRPAVVPVKEPGGATGVILFVFSPFAYTLPPPRQTKRRTTAVQHIRVPRKM